MRACMTKKTKAPFVGTWVSFDAPFTSTVHYTIKKDKQKYVVKAVDADDSEIGEVYDVRWDKEAGRLKFACYWAKSGRFNKCSLMQTDDDKIDFTFTYTDHDVLVRKKRRSAK